MADEVNNNAVSRRIALNHAQAAPTNTQQTPPLDPEETQKFMTAFNSANGMIPKPKPSY